VVLSLAAWRVTALIAEEGGPYDVLERIRYLIGVRYDEYSERYGINVIAKGLCCKRCLSVWVGFVFSLALIGKYENFLEFILVSLSVSAAVIMIDERIV
jgi:hypothetical protein